MNNPELKPGDYVRIVASEYNKGACVGCVSRFTGSHFNILVVRQSPWCSSRGYAEECQLEVEDNYELLTPEQAMEIELSR